MPGLLVKCRDAAGSDFWRLRLQRPLSFERIRSAVKEATGMHVGEMKYRDDEGDLCTLNTGTFEDFDILHGSAVLAQLTLFPGEPCMQMLVGPCTNKAIADADIVASSYWMQSPLHGQGEMWRSRLDNETNPWYASKSDKEQYLQWNLGKVCWIGGVQTKGNANFPQWVTSYTLSHSVDGQAWTRLPLELKGNVDSNTLHTNHVPTFAAQFVRLHPLAWNIFISMRAELLGWIVSTTLPTPLPTPVPMDELRVASIESFTSEKAWRHLGLLECSTRGDLEVACSWKDQGWGNKKGCVRVVLRRAGQDICSEDLFGVCDGGTQRKEYTPVQRSCTIADQVVSSAEPGDEYHFEYSVGGGGSHQLLVKDFVARQLPASHGNGFEIGGEASAGSGAEAEEGTAPSVEDNNESERTSMDWELWNTGQDQ